MTKTKQDKRAKPDAVELNDAALDRAAGGGSVGGAFVATGDVNGDTGYKPVRIIKDVSVATPG